LHVVGAVTLAGTLNVILGFTPATNDTFTIILNDGADAVVGTFAGLPEGATFTVGTEAFRITYAGGDGNDVVLIAGTSCALPVNVVPPYDAVYTATDLCSIPGVPTRYGGLTFLPGDPSTLIIGGEANDAAGKLYSIQVVRDGQNHITGFNGTASFFADAAYNDGGVVFGPGGVLFLVRWPVNELGQTKPSSTTTDKVTDLGPLGVAPSPGALNFVPNGYPGAGQMKMVTYDSGEWYTVAISPDGSGTYNIDSATQNTTIAVGPEGFIYVPPGSPLFPDFNSMLVSEYDNNEVAAYTLDSSGNPVPGSRASFVTGINGAEGAAIDPITGDFLFSTFGSTNRVIRVSGFAPPPPACSLTVTTTTDVVNSGDSVNSLREAIICANTTAGADTITVPAGTYNLTIAGANEDAAATGDLDITEALTINGAGQAITIIDGGALDRAFEIRGSIPVAISGVAIQNGSIRSNGGGIRNDSGNLTITNSTISNNDAGTSAFGGGVYISSGVVNISGSTVRDNRAEDGGGMFGEAGSISIANSTISGNRSVGGGGGGIYNGGGNLTITNTTISGNSANGPGGGILTRGPTTILNSTISGNSSTGAGSFIGGGIYVIGGTTTVVHSTIANNAAVVSGGGIEVVAGATLNLKNSIVANSTSASNCNGAITSQGRNLSSDTSCNLSGTGDLNATDPNLGALANNGGPTQTHALNTGSPAIDAVPTASCTNASGQPLATDQRGQARPFGPACDIGAFEGGTAPLPTPTLAITIGQNSPPAGTTYARGQTLRPMLQFVATAGSSEAVRVNSITLRASGTGNDQTGIISVKVYEDTNGNGQFNAGEPLVGSGAYNTNDGTL
ncbi:MAG: choice-of-anchor Q domain-containing protein, partial [bacterium]